MFHRKTFEPIDQTLSIESLIIFRISNSRAAMSGKIVQHVLVAQCCQKNKHFGTHYRQDCCNLLRYNLPPFRGSNLAWSGIPTAQFRSLPKLNRGIVYCNGLFQTLIIQVDIRFNHTNIKNTDIPQKLFCGQLFFFSFW